MNNIKELAVRIHCNAVKHGFWDPVPGEERCCMLVVTELAEAVDADRKGKHADLDAWKERLEHAKAEGGEVTLFKTYVKDTVEDELADTVIRCLDMLESGYCMSEWKEGIYDKMFFGHWELPDVKCPLPVWAFRCLDNFTKADVYTLASRAVRLVKAVEKYAAAHDIDLERHVLIKMEYNEKRPFKHGKSY